MTETVVSAIGCGLIKAARSSSADALPAQQFDRPERGRKVQLPGRPTVRVVDRETLREEPLRSHG